VERATARLAANRLAHEVHSRSANVARATTRVEVAMYWGGGIIGLILLILLILLLTGNL
jgi:hypothetical protein